MSLINVSNVVVLDNPAPFLSPFQFEITFECLEPGIKEELEWKLVYVGSAEDEKLDQELDAVLVGPISVGKNKFVFSAPAPDPSKIPAKDLMEVTVLLLTCCYRDAEFIRIGYYVNNEYRADSVDLINERTAWMERCKSLQQSYCDALERFEEVKASSAPLGVEGSAPAPAPAPAPAAASALTLAQPAAPVFPPPPPVNIEKLVRNILADKPRVTRFHIPWDNQVQQFIMSAADAEKAAMQESNEEKKSEEKAAQEEEDEDDDDDGAADDDDDDDDDDVDMEDSASGSGSEECDDARAHAQQPNKQHHNTASNQHQLSMEVQ